MYRAGCVVGGWLEGGGVLYLSQDGRATPTGLIDMNNMDVLIVAMATVSGVIGYDACSLYF